MKPNTQHTPTPWKVSQTGKFVMHSRPGTILNVCEASEEDAAFIVRAVNEYQSNRDEIERLKKIIKEGKQYWEGFTDGETEALAAAGKEK